MSIKNRPMQTGGTNETGNDSIPNNYTTPCDCQHHLNCADDDCDSPFCDIRHTCGKEMKTATRIATVPPRTDPTAALYASMAEAKANRPSGDLADYLVLMTDVGKVPPPPAAYMRSDGETLIPENTISSIYGMPSGCKSFIALDIARAVARSGGRVLWWDFEDTKETLKRRCHAIGFGVDDGLDNLGYVPAALADDANALALATHWVKQGDAMGLVVIDACNSAGCPSDGADVAPWFAAHVAPFGKGVTMLLLDHIPKRSDDRAPGAIGSTHKRSALTGVSLLVQGSPWTPKQDGRITLTNEKDRSGVLPAGMHKVCAVVTGTHVDGLLDIRAEPPTGADDGASVRDRIVNALTVAEPDGIRTVKAMRKAAGGRGRDCDSALVQLAGDGVIETVKDGAAMVYRLAREDTPF